MSGGTPSETSLPALASSAQKPVPGEKAYGIEELFRQYNASVARWAARLGGPGFDVHDVVQEVFVIAHRKLTDYSVEARLKVWLFRTTRAVVSQQRRKLKWNRFWHGRPEDLADTLASAKPTPVEDFERRENGAMLRRILEGMREDHRTAIILFEVEGLSGDEIADLMGVKSGTVRVWLHRARQVFIDRLKQEESGT